MGASAREGERVRASAREGERARESAHTTHTHTDVGKLEDMNTPFGRVANKFFFDKGPEGDVYVGGGGWRRVDEGGGLDS